MKKSLLLVLVLGLAFAASGCGFDPTIDSSVMYWIQISKD